jgi:hypothetical protein
VLFVTIVVVLFVAIIVAMRCRFTHFDPTLSSDG